MNSAEESRSGIFVPFQRQTAPGEAPGTIVPHPVSKKPVMQMMAYGPNGEHVEKTLRSVTDIPSDLSGFSVCWINVDGLGDADLLKSFGQRFGLHPLALEDVVNSHQRCKVEDYGEQLFIVARMVAETDPLSTEQVAIFLGKNLVLTFQERAGGDSLNPVRERIRFPGSRIRSQGADFLVYSILDAIVDGYFPCIEVYGTTLDEIDHILGDHADLSAVSQIHRIRSNLILAHRAVWQMREALNSLLRDNHPHFTHDSRIFLRDTHDHTIQLIDVVSTYREIAGELRELHFAQVGTRTNDIMRVLTVVSTIFIPLTFIVGVYGMNFNTHVSSWNMPELNWPHGYLLVWLAMIGLSLIMLYFFWRRGWLRGSRSE